MGSNLCMSTRDVFCDKRLYKLPAICAAFSQRDAHCKKSSRRSYLWKNPKNRFSIFASSSKAAPLSASILPIPSRWQNFFLCLMIPSQLTKSNKKLKCFSIGHLNGIGEKALCFVSLHTVMEYWERNTIPRDRKEYISDPAVMTLDHKIIIRIYPSHPRYNRAVGRLYYIFSKATVYRSTFAPLSWYNDVNFHERGVFLCLNKWKRRHVVRLCCQSI